MCYLYLYYMLKYINAYVHVYKIFKQNMVTSMHVSILHYTYEYLLICGYVWFKDLSHNLFILAFTLHCSSIYMHVNQQ